jgi:hypothetical protein
MSHENHAIIHPHTNESMLVQATFCLEIYGDEVPEPTAAHTWRTIPGRRFRNWPRSPRRDERMYGLCSISGNSCAWGSMFLLRVQKILHALLPSRWGTSIVEQDIFYHTHAVVKSVPILCSKHFACNVIYCMYR